MFLKGEDFSVASTRFSDALINRFQEEKELLAWLTYPLRFASLFINPLVAKYGVRGLGVDLLDVFNRALVVAHPEMQHNIAVIGLNNDGTMLDEVTVAGVTSDTCDRGQAGEAPHSGLYRAKSAKPRSLGPRGHSW